MRNVILKKVLEGQREKMKRSRERAKWKGLMCLHKQLDKPSRPDDWDTPTPTPASLPGL